MATTNEQAQPKRIVQCDLNFCRTTKGTHVLENAELGFSGIYIPKVFFSQAGVNPAEGGMYRMTVEWFNPLKQEVERG